MIKVEEITVDKKHVEVSCCCCSTEETIPVEAVYFNNGQRSLTTMTYGHDEGFIFYRGSLNSCDGGITTSCMQCGSGCESQRVLLRQSGEAIIWMPDFEHYTTGPNWCLSVEQYMQLQKLDDALPSIDAIKLLTKHDCAQIFSDELPEIICFGKLNDLYLNTDAPEGKEIITVLKTMLRDYEQSQEPVTLRRVSENSKLNIILDTPDYFEWKPLCKTDKGYGLCLNLGDQVVEVL